MSQSESDPSVLDFTSGMKILPGPPAGLLLPVLSSSAIQSPKVINISIRKCRALLHTRFLRTTAYAMVLYYNEAKRKSFAKLKHPKFMQFVSVPCK